MSKDTYIKGALILTIAGIIVKIIGAPQRILISRLLGGEGIGLYQMAYPYYLAALNISSAGIPVAISIIVAEKLALKDYLGAKRVFKISLSLLGITGIMFSLLMFFAADWLIQGNILRDARAYWPIIALAPAIFFVTILSSYRGYFQGSQMMTPTAVSQIFEQLIRVVAMLGFAYYLLPKGLEFGAAGATLGAAPGAVVGLLVLIYYYHRESPRLNHLIENEPVVKQESGVSIIKRIIRLALPVSMANVMLPLVQIIDSFFVPNRLAATGYSVSASTALYGYLTGMAVPLVNMATILTASLAASLVPVVSEAYTLGEKERIRNRAATALRINNIITIPAFAGLWLLATPISVMLYNTANAGEVIGIMSVGIFLLGVHQVTTGILQGLGKTAIPVINMMVAAVAKIAIIWKLTAMPEWGINGAAWATNADFGLAAALNMYFIYRYVGFRIDVNSLLKICTATAVMGVTVLFVFQEVMSQTPHNSLAALIAIVCGTVVYGAGILLTGAIEGKDIESVPKVGSKAAKLLKLIGLLRK